MLQLRNPFLMTFAETPYRLIVFKELNAHQHQHETGNKTTLTVTVAYKFSSPSDKLNANIFKTYNFTLDIDILKLIIITKVWSSAFIEILRFQRSSKVI